MAAAGSCYLDYNATAPLATEVAEAMQPWLARCAANPSAIHADGQRARAAVEIARATVARLCGDESLEVVFTSGGTESDNLAMMGTCWPPGGHVIVSAIEHPAVLEPAAALESSGTSVTRIPVDANGRIDPGDVRSALQPDTRLVSVMAANNEVGTLQPIEMTAAIAHEAGVPLHCDAVQAGSWLDLRPICAAANLVSITAHKMGGPPGIGALVLRPETRISPLIRGGGQQGGRRGGTEPTALIVGMGAACDRVIRHREVVTARVRSLRDSLEAGILAAIPGVLRNGPVNGRLPNTSHLSFDACRGDVLVARLDLEGVAASAGSACASGVTHDSHVLEAMGVPQERAAGALRLSLGYESSTEDVARALGVLPRLVASVRAAGADSTTGP